MLFIRLKNFLLSFLKALFGPFLFPLAFLTVEW
jgi:hypothetical protein